MVLTDVMDALGAALQEIADVNVYAFPPDAVTVPALVVRYPESITYDSTMARGADELELIVVALVGKVSDRGARTSLNSYIDGDGERSVKQAVEADPTLDGNCHTLRVAEAEVVTNTVGGIEYLAVEFTIEIVA
jgi:hypothetical protein